MFNRATQTVQAVDPEVFAAIQNEHRRQEQHIELIASENYASPAVMAAQGSQPAANTSMSPRRSRSIA